MSFREKMHWVSFLAIIGGFSAYFISLWYGQGAGGTDNSYYFGLLVLIIGGIIIAMTVAAIIMAIGNIGDAKAVQDERDRNIHARGTLAAYYTLLLGCWALIAASFLGTSPFFLINMLLAIIVMAEIIRIGTQLYLYRRGY